MLQKKVVRAAFLSSLPALLFVAGLVWVLLFPAVSISSGELKPRGLYVDEHSLLVQSNIVGTPPLVHPHDFPQSTCEPFETEFQCRYFGNVTTTRICQIEVLPRHAVNFFESTVLVFQYNPGYNCSYYASLTLAQSVVAELREVRWNARKVIILLVPNGGDTAESELLQQWLGQHHTIAMDKSKHTHSLLLKSSISIGNIREAYIFNLTDADICNDTNEFNHESPPATALSSASLVIAPSTDHDKPASLLLYFDSATIHYTGPDGLLPNMDIIAYPLSKYPKILVTESQQCATSLHKAIDSLYVHYKYSDSGDATTALLQPMTSLLDYVDAMLLLPAYKQRLLGLLCSMQALVTTEHSLHGYFARYNIDAITIKPTKSSAEAKKRTRNSDGKVTTRSTTLSKRKGPSVIKKSSKSVMYKGDTLLQMAMTFVYVSNNLQEKLHHSHFYYLLMGSGHFTSINEYGFTAALFLLSVLCMMVQVSSRCTFQDAKLAVCNWIVGVMPIIVWLFAIVPVLSQGNSDEYAGMRCIPITDALYSMYGSGEVKSLVEYVACWLQALCMVLTYYVPIESIAAISKTLCILPCIAVFVTGSNRKEKECIAELAGQTDASTAAKVVDTPIGLGQVELDQSISADTAKPHVSVLDSKDNLSPMDRLYSPIATNEAAVSAIDAGVVSVCLLCVLMILAHNFAHNFSLGLLLTCLHLPSTIVVASVQSCHMRTVKWKLVSCVVLLAVVLVYQVMVLWYIEHWFSVHSYAYRIILLLGCVVSVGVCSTLAGLLRIL